MQFSLYCIVILSMTVPVHYKSSWLKELSMYTLQIFTVVHRTSGPSLFMRVPSFAWASKFLPVVYDLKSDWDDKEIFKSHEDMIFFQHVNPLLFLKLLIEYISRNMVFQMTRFWFGRFHPTHWVFVNTDWEGRLWLLQKFLS